MMAPKSWRNREPPDVIPLFPLAGVILLPRGQLPLNVFEPRYLAMVEDVLKGERIIGMIQPSAEATAHTPPLYAIGGAGRITSFAEIDDGRYHIGLTGISRFVLESELKVETPYRQARVGYTAFAGDLMAQSDEGAANRPSLLASLKRYFAVNRIDADWESIERAPLEALVNSLSMISPVEPAEKQALLEAPTVAERARILVALIELSLAKPRPDGAHKPN